MFYWVFAYFREQACVAVCPYGRLQGVLLDKKSIAVMYDWIRGEPRGRLSKKAEQTEKGDCIDCKLCVHACPTGIDIRHGTQLECVNCTACIDACDEVMTKINKPTGLIRYASHDSIETGAQSIWTTRAKAYTVVLTLLVGILSVALFTRSDVEATVMKVPGQLYTEVEEGQISNLFKIQFVNKTNAEMTLGIRVTGVEGINVQKAGGGEVTLQSQALAEGTYIITIPKENLTGMQTGLEVEIIGNGEVLETKSIKFMGPVVLK